MRKGVRRRVLVIGAVALVLAGSIAGLFLNSNARETTVAEPMVQATAAPPPEPVPQAPRQLAYGIDITDCRLVKHRIHPHQNLSDILTSYGVDYGAVMDIAHKANGVFNVRSLRPNRPYCLVIPHPSEDIAPSHFVYEINLEEYVVFSLAVPRSVTLGRKPVTTAVRRLAGTVEESLWQSVTDQGGDSALMAALAEIYAWSVDFHYLRAGDTYQVLFEDKYIEGSRIGIGRIRAAMVGQGDIRHFAFRFGDGQYDGYIDENGRSLEKAFLKSPVRYSRISSRFSHQRLHPVLKTVKAHLGTDYAAPVGTPVMSTGDGTVVMAGHDRNNGNYVKIRHNGTYATQYLHLSRFAKGIRRGAVVKQGEVVGYVGASGMATGPHLCYRFWKNGRQIDPLTTPLPASRQLSPEQLARFEQTLPTLMAQLASPADAMTLAQKP